MDVYKMDSNEKMIIEEEKEIKEEGEKEKEEEHHIKYSNCRHAREKHKVKNKGNFFLSTLYPSEIVINNITYKTAAHYIQSQKYISSSPLFSNEICKCETAKEAVLLGKGKIISTTKHFKDHNKAVKLNNIIEQYKPLKDPLWLLNDRRFAVFLRATYFKFTQHDDLKEKLIKTHPYHIYEDSSETFWGIGKKCGKGFVHGKNMAGKALMIIREVLRSKEDKKRKMQEEEENCIDDTEKTILSYKRQKKDNDDVVSLLKKK